MTAWRAYVRDRDQGRQIERSLGRGVDGAGRDEDNFGRLKLGEREDGEVEPYRRLGHCVCVGESAGVVVAR